MRHTLWLMPLTVGIILMAWCIHTHLSGGPVFLAVLFILVSIIAALFVRFDHINMDYTPEYQAITVHSKIGDM